MSSFSNNFTHPHLGVAKCSHSDVCLASALHSAQRAFKRQLLWQEKHNSNFLNNSSYSHEKVAQTSLT